MFFENVPYDGWVYSDWVTKTVWGTQAYENKTTYTALNNPCRDCQILSKIAGNQLLAEGIITIMGQTKNFSSTDFTGSPNDYHLMIKRADFTLLKTIHGAIWHIQNK